MFIKVLFEIPGVWEEVMNMQILEFLVAIYIFLA